MTRRVVIIGGGYAGVAAARGLVRHAPADTAVTLVNDRPYFVERVRLHQLAAGQPFRRIPLARLVGERARTRIGTVTAVDLARRRLHFADAPYSLAYDVLVYAIGSGPTPSPVPGMDDVAHTVAVLDAATRTRVAVDRLSDGATVNVVGGGLTGLEVAAELAESRPRLQVQLVTSGPLGGWLTARAREHLGAGFERVGVGIRDRTEVTLAELDALHTADGGRIASDLTVWAGGFSISALAADAGLEVDPIGRVVVDERLRSRSHPDVFAVGDVAAAAARGGKTGRMSCQTALPMGTAVSRVIAADLRGDQISARPSRYVWTNISIGRRDAVTQFTRADDSPLPAVLTGAAAAKFKEAITRSTVFTLGGTRLSTRDQETAS